MNEIIGSCPEHGRITYDSTSMRVFDFAGDNYYSFPCNGERVMKVADETMLAFFRLNPGVQVVQRNNIHYEPHTEIREGGPVTEREVINFVLDLELEFPQVELEGPERLL